ncbi:F0F1 ATP synthase subunit B [Clostridium hydrogenum]|uniref:F0F1 ATP synthase subunit B n=1 Tax=Clostridium hydrogenum TaxID=2855764 RepID=UPI001F390F94|nr:F0F1 ATP synthase subunit B [Clostridium hydrogenum]
MGIDLVRVVYSLINFALFLIVVHHFLYKPVNKVMSSRTKDIEDTINSANEDKSKAEALRIENEKKLASAKEEGKTIVENFKAKAEKVSDEITKGAQDEAQLILERAKREAEREKEKAEDEIKAQVIELAVLVSSKALDKSINEEEHRRLIEDFVAKVGI